MSKSNISENDMIGFTFNKIIPSWMGTLATTGSANLYIALHTADPGEAGTQATSEATYTSYARVAVERTGSGWTVSGNQASNTSLIQFPQCTGGSNTITYVSVGTDSSGATEILYSGALNSSLSVTNLIQPQFSAGALVIQED